MKRISLALALLLIAMLSLTACSANKRAAFEKGLKLFSEGEYLEASQAFGQAGDYGQAKVYYDYSRGVIYYDRGEYEAARDSFENVQDFMYGRDRYIYSAARVCEETGDFSGAAELYDKLTDYEDAAQRANYARGRIAESNKDYDTALFEYAEAGAISDAPDLLENLRTQMYIKALELKRAGYYADALNLFGKLEGYLDCAAQAIECKDYYREELYASAEALLAQGDKHGAYMAFLGLTGYSDAEQRAQELALQLGIEHTEPQEE